MMLPDRHVFVDAEQLQALLDADQRAVTERLRELRGAVLSLFIGSSALLLMVAIAAILTAAVRGVA